MTLNHLAEYLKNSDQQPMIRSKVIRVFTVLVSCEHILSFQLGGSLRKVWIEFHSH